MFAKPTNVGSFIKLLVRMIYKEVARDRLFDPLATLSIQKVPIPVRKTEHINCKIMKKRTTIHQIGSYPGKKNKNLFNPSSAISYMCC
jgi:hypothetical protein